jgi:predicted 3-demethylubiquinone-9 3-methyltransferase (glyoxalase superfamily)
MHKIVPYLWYNNDAVEAAKWYVSIFENSKIIQTGLLTDTPSGDVETVEFQLANLTISAISGGPYFTLNSSISLMVACESMEEVDRLYSQLFVGGTELMPLGEYPFSKRYAWFSDKYGLNWQLFMVENRTEHFRIRPTLLFSTDVCGKAEEAMDYYMSIFKEAKKGYINHYAPMEAVDQRAGVNYAELYLPGLPLVCMDHAMGGEDAFNEAFSFMILCESQDEIDYYWDKLSFVPEAEQCGWLKDPYGVSWQVVPANLNDILFNGSKEEVERVTEAFMSMKKFDFALLEKARLGTE